MGRGSHSFSLRQIQESSPGVADDAPGKERGERSCTDLKITFYETQEAGFAGTSQGGTIERKYRLERSQKRREPGIGREGPQVLAT